MPYPSSFHRIVAIGSLYGDEQFNFSLSVVPQGSPLDAVTETFANSVGAVIASWFDNAQGATGVGITSAARLTSVKVNRINAAGLYQDPDSIENIVVGGVAGGGSGFPAPQLTVAVTLATDVPRGRGSKGRFYLPPLASTTTMDNVTGKMTSTQADQICQGATALIDSINGVYAVEYDEGDFNPRVGVASNAGAGVFRAATEIRIGRVVDTMRSRRASLTEQYSTRAVA